MELGGGDTLSQVTAPGDYLEDPSIRQRYMQAAPETLLPAMVQYEGNNSIQTMGDALRSKMLNYPNENGMDGLDYLARTVFSTGDQTRIRECLEKLGTTLPIGAIEDIAMLSYAIDQPDPNQFYDELAAEVGINADQLVTVMRDGMYRNDIESLWPPVLTADSGFYSGSYASSYISSGFTGFLQEALTTYGDLTIGLIPFANQWSGSIPHLLSVAMPGELPEVQYSVAPAEYLKALVAANGVLVLDTLLTVVEDVNFYALTTYTNRLAPNTTASNRDELLMALGSHQHNLAEHHLYGSARLGTKQYWPGEVGSTWDYTNSVFDTGGLNIPVPWYNNSYGDLLNANTTSVWGNQLSTRAVAQHTLGQKQYELTNHLGNVQVTVSDKRHWATHLLPVPDNGGGSTNVPFKYQYRPAIVPAYDYYPIAVPLQSVGGMLMPGRWATDNSIQCANITQTRYVKVFTKVPLTYGQFYAVNTGYGNMNISVPSSGTGVEIESTTAGQEVEAVLSNVTPGETQDLEMNISYLSGTSYRAVVTEELIVNGAAIISELAGVIIDNSGVYTIPFTPSATNGGQGIRVSITANGAGTTAYDPGWYKVTYVPQNTVVRICNTGLDRYRFGFNGQMKVNEIAGVGNSLDFGARMYNSRLGRWWSIDKLSSSTPSLTPYRFAFNNPIRYSDIDGNFEIDEATAKAYPQLKPALARLHAYLSLPQNQALSARIAKAGNFKDAEQLLSNLADRHGPKLKVANIVSFESKKIVTHSHDDFANQTTTVNGTILTPVLTKEGEKLKEGFTSSSHPGIAFTLTNSTVDGSGNTTINEQEVYLDNSIANMLEAMPNTFQKSLKKQMERVFNHIIIHELGHVGDSDENSGTSLDRNGKEAGTATEKAFDPEKGELKPSEKGPLPASFE